MSQRNQTHSTIQEINLDLYPSMCTAVILLMVMSVSTAKIDRNAASQELSVLYNDTVHKDTELDVECIIHQFTHQKNRRIALLLFSP